MMILQSVVSILICLPARVLNTQKLQPSYQSTMNHTKEGWKYKGRLSVISENITTPWKCKRKVRTSLSREKERKLEIQAAPTQVQLSCQHPSQSCPVLQKYLCTRPHSHCPKVPVRVGAPPPSPPSGALEHAPTSITRTPQRY